MSRARDLADGTFSGEFAADSPTLVVDATNNRVGVGTASPARTLHVQTNQQVIGRFNAGTNTKAILSLEDTNTTGENYVSIASEGNDMFFRAGGQDRMRIDNAGRVTMPYQPYFGAFKSGGLDTGTGVLVFDSVLNNTGGHYNNTNGRFTAPVNGVYAFTCQVFWLGTGSDVVARCDWRFNGAIRSEGKYGLIGTQDYLQQQTTFMRYMAAGDYLDINVSVNPAGILCGTDNFTWLYGFLLG